ncbi:glycosyltransferase family 5 protein [Xylona heveae TC161]|uniref:alpha-1,3-glucan synthase n=1 Tax=Xylona heveae (strain CBS 132557 / TC161) TaxID=1328760 RepID=A0A165H1G3_XYLHT|nr:glycosyltransferase family 5 protein [Xylona heveae TC161]KZF22864.1 glycosyltransferase family 5 protein [Xylona heveae TC161]
MVHLKSPKMLGTSLSILLALLIPVSHSLRYDPAYEDWNLNTNKTAIDPLDYWGEWENHTYTPSPENWRMPFYSFFLDRFVNGDPANDDINGTAWEHDLYGTQLRYGGDVDGLKASLDYLQGMGVKGIYLAGSPHINVPWENDGYSPLDLTLLDAHFGNISAWRECVADIHSRGMYVILDNTMATMGDLIGFEGYLNASTPFNYKEHNALWKYDRRYNDFSFGNSYIDKCEYPRFWGDDGFPVHKNGTEHLIGCRDSEFDQYGDIAAFGDYPEWQRQISKFAFVQDRLREWRSDVRAKIQHFSCITIMALDIDGFRMDKGLQITVDAQGDFADHLRQCAATVGKHNFYIPGEIVAGNAFGSIYIGRGKQPDMMIENMTEAITMTNSSNSSAFIRDVGKNAFDGAAFHYSVYRAMGRFLGLDGNMAAADDTPVNWVAGWEALIQTNDMLNAVTGVFDPRHMFGVTNQDVFRWPGIKNGTHRQNLGIFVITLMLPGIPTLSWGEEQAFYVLDNTANNYVFGRSPMASSQAWQDHGCYKVGSQKYWDFPLESSLEACKDDWVSLDHRDPSHPVRNIYKSMFEMRERFPALNDGFLLKQLSNQTWDIYLPGSYGTPTETGVWSVVHAQWPGVQDFSHQGHGGNQSVWLVYTNNNVPQTYTFNCSIDTLGLIAPFDPNVTVKNLFYPFEEYTLETSVQNFGLEGVKEWNGCLSAMHLDPWDYKAFVPKDKWLAPSPMLTGFTPGHDTRILSKVPRGQQDTVAIELDFSTPMDCDSVRDNMEFQSSTEDRVTAKLDRSSIKCLTVAKVEAPKWPGGIPTAWTFKANLVDVSHGIHQITIRNVTSQNSTFTNSVDHFFIRVGDSANPVVFPRTGNYSTSLFHESEDGKELVISHSAPGADKFRYSTTWGSSYSNWLDYTGGNTTIQPTAWSGTKAQRWTGEHVTVQYWSRIAGSSDHVQEGELHEDGPARRFPHLSLHGPWNEFGYDAGLPNVMKQDKDGIWNFNFMTEWPAQFQVNVWGMNPDGEPDVTAAFGDVDNDTVLDRIPPITLMEAVVNITEFPPSPHLAYRISVNDADRRYTLTPVGSRWKQLALFLLLAFIPPLTGALGVWAYLRAFYQVKFNQVGVSEKGGIVPLAVRKIIPERYLGSPAFQRFTGSSTALSEVAPATVAPVEAAGGRRTVLIATMEYDIEDWEIKIKIGGLGVMAQLMGKNLGHQDLIWVVPCAGGIDYPIDQRAEPMVVKVLGNEYIINVQYHTLRNITYVLLDAPVFRQQTKAEPYPPRMDDIDSAIYYSAWNQCIAEAIRRFPIDLYHINDYHGTVAPLYLLPDTIPVCLSLHNAEFQGLWPMRSALEVDEVSRVYNLDAEIVRRYVQFGEVFNLLHAGASYLRIHQKGFGAVGVSKKYGKRSFARYPIFWGLSKIGSLPNPDPTDVGDWNKQPANPDEVVVDAEFEASRAPLKRQAQEWAGLEQNPNAELFVFVGRWSMQKGVDLIADVFPAVLEENSNVQLICIGPVIDLYGKFAALKLDHMMKVYPNRVFSRPEFTALPPYIFSGAEFALIPSRDEPFGLVAVEFGRKGALGVGSRVGGLGQMPGWWYTIESTTTKHLIQQFKQAIHGALDSKQEVRAIMRARSAKQRFPVAQWVEDLGILQETSIKIHKKQALKPRRLALSGAQTPVSGSATPRPWAQSRTPSFFNMSSASSMYRQPWMQAPSIPTTAPQSGPSTRAGSPSREGAGAETGPQTLSLGTRVGPGHVPEGERGRRMSRLTLSRDSSVSRSAPASRAASPSDDSGLAGRQRRRLSKPNPFGDNNAVGVANGGQEAGSSRQLTAIDEHGQGSSRQRLSDGSQATAADDAASNVVDEYILTPEQARESEQSSQLASLNPASFSSRDSAAQYSPSVPQSPYVPFSPAGSMPTSPRMEDYFLSPYSRADANLSLASVVGEKKDYTLQKVEPFFTDPTGLYYKTFDKMLDNLNGKTSESNLCVEEYLVKSEKNWFSRFHDAKMGKTSVTVTPASSIFRFGRSSPAASIFNEPIDGTYGNGEEEGVDQFLLQDDYTPPTGFRKILATKFGDWPVYSFLLAFGQIIAANSYQISLLTGEIGETASKLYTVACIYLAASIIWWCVFRTLKSVYVLSLPFVFYGLAFVFLAFSPYGATMASRNWVQNVATGFYAVASASGSFFFALNFGAEGSVPVESWSFRACVIQGTQQIYVSVLWLWGAKLVKINNLGKQASTVVTYGWPRTVICLPIALLLFGVGAVLFLGLPEFYRQSPGKVPSFYSSVIRRKIILWFFVAVIIQNFFLSAPYGRNWQYFWSTKHAPTYAIVLLLLLFFIGIWAACLYLFSRLSTRHSWVLPIFAVALGAPRWCQMLWGVSNIGLYVPWAGTPVGSAVVGRILWLWLGVLDALQGVGFGMILLQTLTRFHIIFTLVSAQVLGSIATIVARACGPNKVGPGDVFPDFSAGYTDGLHKAWFWIALFFQLAICVGFFKFFRKEQLSKP